MRRIVIRMTVELRSNAWPNAWARGLVARSPVGLLQRLEQLSRRARGGMLLSALSLARRSRRVRLTSSETAANSFVGLVAGSVVPTTFQRTYGPIGFRRLGPGHQWSTHAPLRCRITGARPAIDAQPRRHVSPRPRSCPELPPMAADRPRQEGRQEGRQDAPLDAPQFVLIIEALARGTSYSQPRRQPGIPLTRASRKRRWFTAASAKPDRRPNSQACVEIHP